MTRFNHDFSSRFRILKGGKISLVVSALLLSSTLVVNDANANVTINTAVTTNTDFTSGNTESLDITSAGSIIVSDGTATALDIITNDLALDQTITNNGTISLSGGSNASTIYSNVAINGNIINNGTIENTVAAVAGAAAMNFTHDVSGDLTNNGTVAVTSNGFGWGINFDDDVTGEVINTSTGSITVNSDSEAYGLRLSETSTGGLSGSILNSGSIDATSTSSNAFGIDVKQMTGNTDATTYIKNNTGGTITVASDTEYGYGINVNDVLGENAGIYNDGTIDVTSANSGYGISASGTSPGFKVTNTGLIEMNSAGFYNITGISIQSGLSDSTTRASNIENSGTITITQTFNDDDRSIDGFGIALDNLYDNTTVSNSGTISVDNSVALYGRGYGIVVEGNLYDNASITNALDGTISINAGEDGFGIKTGSLNNDASITNAGEIIINAGLAGGDGENIDAYGIELDGARMYGASRIENSGTISINSAGMGTGIATQGMEGTAEIVNSGTIELELGTYGAAIGVFNQGMTGGNSVTNSGTITVNSDAVAYGIWVQTMDDGTNASTISNTGTITVDGVNASTALRIGGSDSNDIITNSGTLTATVGGVADTEGYALKLSGAATFTNTSTGEMYGNVYTDGDVVVNNAGLISLPHNANATMATLNNTGTLQIGLKTDGTDEGTSYSKLVAGSATFADGSKLAVNVLNTSTNVGLLAGERLENVVASTALTINGTLNITDNSALLNFEYVTDGFEGEAWTNGGSGTIHLDIVEGTTLLDSAVSGGANTSTKQAAKTLQTISDNLASHPAMTSVFTELNTLSTDEAVAKAIESTTPVAATASVGTTAQISNGIAGIVQQRQNVTMGGGLNSGDEMFSEKNFWIKPFGSFGEQNDKDGSNGFDLKAHGVGFGVDGSDKNDNIFGAGFFYTNASVDVNNNVGQTTDLDVYTVLLYGNSPIVDNSTKLLYQAGYSWQKTESKREVFTGDRAEAKYTGTTAYANVKVLKDFKVNDKFMVQPLLETTYRHFENPEYSENGAGALNLQMDKFTSTELIVGTGAIGYYKLTDETKFIGNLNVGYDVKDDKNVVTSSYQGASALKFETEGIDNGRWSYEAGAAIETNIDKNSNINFSYNYNGKGSDFSNNTFSARYVLKF